jgi:hypothetical protein
LSIRFPQVASDQRSLDTSPGFFKFYEHLVCDILDRGGATAAAEVQQDKGIKHLDAPLDTRISPQAALGVGTHEPS